MKKAMIICLMAIVGVLSAQGQMAKMEALYLLQFAKNTSWPREDNGKPLVITVVGDNALVKELKAVASAKMVGNRKIEIAEASTAKAINKSDIIFVGESKSAQMGSLISTQSGSKVLIVSGAKGMCSRGAGISFLSEGDKLNFEIHEGNIARNGLRMAQKMVSLGKQVM
ncbi:MAG: YfiR family protein [Bacteroidales bacterium]|jgi:hypothetical protein|nr:YfiR family protein [Bacteroidales bacterium]